VEKDREVGEKDVEEKEVKEKDEEVEENAYMLLVG
jgi:hypothetical protein